MRNALSNSEKFAVVSLYQLLEGRNVSIFAGVDKIKVVARRFPHCELCRVSIHIHAPEFSSELSGAATDATASRGSFSLRAIQKPELTAPRLCRSFSGESYSSTDTFQPW